MTGYSEQIEAARADVDALLKDAQELKRLHDERAAQLEELKTSGSRDFARMAEVEGQRAALATMLTDQEAEVKWARAALAALEREGARDAKLARVGEVAGQIAEIQAQFLAGLDELRAHLDADLSRLFTLEGKWTALRPEWTRVARELGYTTNSRTEEAARAIQPLYDELAARGVDVLALRVTRPYMDAVAGGLLDHRTLPVSLEGAPYEAHLRNLVLELYARALGAKLEANTRETARKVAANE